MKLLVCSSASEPGLFEFVLKLRKDKQDAEKNEKYRIEKFTVRLDDLLEKNFAHIERLEVVNDNISLSLFLILLMFLHLLLSKTSFLVLDVTATLLLLNKYILA